MVSTHSMRHTNKCVHILKYHLQIVQNDCLSTRISFTVLFLYGSLKIVINSPQNVWDVMVYLCVFTSKETLLKPTVHGQWDEKQQSRISQELEGSQKGAAKWLVALVLTKFSGQISVDVVQEHRHKNYSQNTHTCRDQEPLG